MNISIALAQLDLKVADPERNFLKVQEAVQTASQNGAEIVLLPELWASGFDLDRTRTYANSLDEGWFKRMRDLAKRNEIGLGGSLIEDDQGKYYNTFVLYDNNGDRLVSYRKIHLFQKLQEHVHLTGGAEVAVVDSPWGKLGFAICYDLRFPEIFRSCAVQGAELILLVAEWPSRRIEHWKILLQARAIENQCYIAAVNKVGNSHGAVFGGNSLVVDPMGKILIQGGEKEELLQASLDLDEVSKIRKWMPVFDDRRPGFY